MKKTFKILLSIIIILLIFGLIIWRIFVNYAGEYVISTIIDSVDEDTITELEKSLDVIQNIEEPAIQPPQSDSAETEQNNNTDDTTNPDTTGNETVAAENTPPKTDTENNESSKLSSVTYEDKSAAIRMMKNKFSISEIKYYQDKVMNEGITSELMSEVKSILKSRCTRAEIDQIKEWYYKYR